MVRKELESSFNVNLSESASVKDLIKMLQTEIDAKIAISDGKRKLLEIETLDINETNPQKIKVLLVKQKKQIELLSQQVK